MLCSNPAISIVASAIRTELWAEMIKSLQKFNSTSYEIIFVGDKNPDFTLPKNVRHIYTEVKPSQCYEIGFREAKGDYINWTADDVHYGMYSLDYIYNQIKSQDNLILAFNCIENGSPTSEGHTIFEKGSQRMAPIGVMKRSLLKELGGYDNRFICGQAENDLVMRAVKEKGAIVEICKEALVYINHDLAHKGKSKFRVDDGYDYHKHDRNMIEEMWRDSDRRKIDFRPYKDENILLETQGEKGEWK